MYTNAFLIVYYICIFLYYLSISFHFLHREKLSKKQLSRKLSLCREVLKVSEIVETGIATKIGKSEL